MNTFIRKAVCWKKHKKKRKIYTNGNYNLEKLLKKTRMVIWKIH